MLIAINTKRNNKLYKSIQVHNDLSLQETENNKWIAPEYLIEDYGEEEKGTEIELIYIGATSFMKNLEDGNIKKIFKSSYFRNAKNKTGVKFKESNKNHERVQNFILNYLIENSDDIKFKISNKIEQGLKEDFYYISLKELEPNFAEIDFEITLKDSDIKKRADIFLKINKKNEIFGKALCIEIQLSSQTYDKTEERTLHRAYLGMSTIWINTKDVEIEKEFIYLKTKELEILPYLHVLNKANEKATEIIRLEYERQGILIDNKIEECKKAIEEYKSLTIAGQICPICNKEGRIGFINKKKDGTALFCDNYHKSGSSKCNVWVNL